MAIPNNFKQSLIIAKQLPEFINNESAYSTFVLFVKAYYEWLETELNVSDRIKNLVNYKDIDDTLEEFQNYFFNVFIPHFPDTSLTDRKELVKYSKEFYQRKGTESSFKFLFRALYNVDCELVNTRKFILKSSDGKWIVSKLIKLNTLDSRFLDISNYYIVGESSKAIAKIERTKYSIGKILVYISDIVKEFYSGEYVRIIDNQYNDIIVDGENLRAKIVGAINTVTVLNGGLNYKINDPVIFYGGINPTTENPIEAQAIISKVSQGTISGITLIDGGTGYLSYPNTLISLTGSGIGASAVVANVNTANPKIIDYVSLDSLSTYANIALNSSSYGFPTFSSANSNTIILDALTFLTLNTYPISEVSLLSRGSGYDASPQIDISSYYTVGNTAYTIKSLGICSDISIVYGGKNYRTGDTITISGGSGSSAYANISNVDSTGSISSIRYIYNALDLAPLGGLGYKKENLPTANAVCSTNNNIITYLTSSTSNPETSVLHFSNTANIQVGMFVSGNNIALDRTHDYFTTNTKVVSVTTNTVTISSNLSNKTYINDAYTFDGTAILTIPSIVGDSAIVSVATSSLGEILDIKLISSGDDYIETPNISIKILNIIVYNVDVLNLPLKEEIIYQGNAASPTFFAYVGSINKLEGDYTNLYVLQTFNYNGTLNITDELYIDRNGIDSRDLTFFIKNTYNTDPYVAGLQYFGNGKALANCNFSIGVISKEGKYLNSDGHLSSYCVLQSDLYNNFSYILTVEKALSAYKNVVQKLLHPVGTRLYTKSTITSNTDVTPVGTSLILQNYKISANAEMKIFYDYLQNEDDIVLFEDSNNEILITGLDRGYDFFDIEYPSQIMVSDELQDESGNTYYYNDSNTNIVLYQFLTDVNPYYSNTSNSSTLVIKKSSNKVYLDIDFDNTPYLNILQPNKYITLYGENYQNVHSQIRYFDASNNVIYLTEPTLLLYSNVFYAQLIANNTFSVTNLTGRYDYINSGSYINTDYLRDVLQLKDKIVYNNISSRLVSIDYDQKIIVTENHFLYTAQTNPMSVSVMRNFKADKLLITN